MPMLVTAAAPIAAGTRVNLSATASMQLPNDEVVINFRVEKEGSNVELLRQAVNKITYAIQARLKQEAGLKLKTISRNMQPIWQQKPNQARQRTGWRMLQTGQVISQNLDAVPSWLDAIESAGAHLSNLQFRVSAKQSLLKQDQLRLQAIAIFKNKAAVIAQGLAAKSFRVIRLNTSSQTPRAMVYRSEMAMMARSSASGTASLVAGEGKLSVTVSGEIETAFIDFPSHK